MKLSEYKALKIKKFEQENKDYNKISGLITFLAYIVRWKKREALVLIVIILIAVIILQYLHFDFSTLKFGK